jgi:CheY-like chemotaxis protein
VSISPANDRALVVLVVEDELVLRWQVAGCLREAGYVVIETTSGEEAMALCNADTSIDVVFTDINLAGPATGWDVAEHFHRHRPELPVLYTSGLSVDARRCVPGSVFVSKPYQFDDVLDVCQRLASK